MNGRSAIGDSGMKRSITLDLTDTQVVALGVMFSGMSTYQMAEQLEKYVSPYINRIKPEQLVGLREEVTRKTFGIIKDVKQREEPPHPRLYVEINN